MPPSGAHLRCYNSAATRTMPATVSNTACLFMLHSFFVFCFLEISDALADFFSLFSVDVVSTAHHDEMRARISGHAQWQLKRPCLPTTTTHPRVLLRSRILPTPPPLLLCNRRPSLVPFERRYVSVKINGNTTFLPDKRSRSRREKNE